MDPARLERQPRAEKITGDTARSGLQPALAERSEHVTAALPHGFVQRHGDRARGGGEGDDLDQAVIRTDSGPVRRRWPLRQLIGLDARNGVPQPQNPEPNRLLQDARDGDRLEPMV